MPKSWNSVKINVICLIQMSKQLRVFVEIDDVPICTDLYRNRYRTYRGVMYRCVYRYVPICTDLYRRPTSLMYRNVPKGYINPSGFGTKKVSVHGGEFLSVFKEN